MPFKQAIPGDLIGTVQNNELVYVSLVQYKLMATARRKVFAILKCQTVSEGPRGPVWTVIFLVPPRLREIDLLNSRTKKIRIVNIFLVWY